MATLSRAVCAGVRTTRPAVRTCGGVRTEPPRDRTAAQRETGSFQVIRPVRRLRKAKAHQASCGGVDLRAGPRAGERFLRFSHGGSPMWKTGVQKGRLRATALQTAGRGADLRRAEGRTRGGGKAKSRRMDLRKAKSRRADLRRANGAESGPWQCEQPETGSLQSGPSGRVATTALPRVLWFVRSNY